MSSEDHSSSSSAINNNNAPSKGKQHVACERPFNEEIEIGPSITGSSLTMSRGSNSISPSVRENCNAPAKQVEWRRKSSNEVRPPNRNMSRLNNNCGPINETSPYQATNVMAPHMVFPQPNILAYGMISPPNQPVPFIGNPEPSTSFSYQGLNALSYAFYFPYYYPTHPHFRYCTPFQDIYAAQQSYYFNQLDDLRTRLRKQIEYYFSSENLETDFYLKRQMDAEGCIPITLIVGFNRVKALMKEVQLIHNNLILLNVMPNQISMLSDNEQFISESLRSSDDVEVQGDKIRKRHEWEKWVSPQILLNPVLNQKN